MLYYDNLSYSIWSFVSLDGQVDFRQTSAEFDELKTTVDQTKKVAILLSLYSSKIMIK